MMAVNQNSQIKQTNKKKIKNAHTFVTKSELSGKVMSGGCKDTKI